MTTLEERVAQMPTRTSLPARGVLAVVAALTSACLVPSLSAAATIGGELRVEGPERSLAASHTQFTGPGPIRTDTRPACGGTGKEIALAGSTALGLIADAADVSPSGGLAPLGVSDKFSFGLLVCGIGDFLSSDAAFWLYKLNHVAPDVGADQQKIKAGDEVLWYFSDTAKGLNTGDELALAAPVRAKPGEVEVKVSAYDGKGKAKPADGALVSVGKITATTGPDGKASIELAEGVSTLRATRKGDVASEELSVCVAEKPSECPSRRSTEITGSNEDDRIKGTGASDVVFANRGDDAIDVRGGGRDNVRCGKGRDSVKADRTDRVAADCERRK